jgi:hypothetical protein
MSATASASSSSSSLDAASDRKAEQIRKMQEGSRRAREAGIKPQTLSERAAISYNGSGMRSQLAWQDSKAPTNASGVAQLLAMEQVYTASLMHTAKNADGMVTEAGIQLACALNPHFEAIAAPCLPVRHLSEEDYQRMQDAHTRHLENKENGKNGSKKSTKKKNNGGGGSSSSNKPAAPEQ